MDGISKWDTTVPSVGLTLTPHCPILGPLLVVGDRR